MAGLIPAVGFLQHNGSLVGVGDGFGTLGQVGMVNRQFAVADECLSVFLNILSRRISLFRETVGKVLRERFGGSRWGNVCQ